MGLSFSLSPLGPRSTAAGLEPMLESVFDFQPASDENGLKGRHPLRTSYLRRYIVAQVPYIPRSSLLVEHSPHALVLSSRSFLANSLSISHGIRIFHTKGKAPRPGPPREALRRHRSKHRNRLCHSAGAGEAGGEGHPCLSQRREGPAGCREDEGGGPDEARRGGRKKTRENMSYSNSQGSSLSPLLFDLFTVYAQISRLGIGRGFLRVPAGCLAV